MKERQTSTWNDSAAVRHSTMSALANTVRVQVFKAREQLGRKLRAQFGELEFE